MTQHDWTETDSDTQVELWNFEEHSKLKLNNQVMYIWMCLVCVVFIFQLNHVRMNVALSQAVSARLVHNKVLTTASALLQMICSCREKNKCQNILICSRTTTYKKKYLKVLFFHVWRSHVRSHVRKYISGETKRWRGGWGRRGGRGGGGGIIRLNDIKEQSCDSEQLVFPSVDRRCFRVHICVCLMETDCAVIVHFWAGLCSLGLLTASAQKKRQTWQMTLNQMFLSLFPLKIFLCLKTQKRKKKKPLTFGLLMIHKWEERWFG